MFSVPSPPLDHRYITNATSKEVGGVPELSAGTPVSCFLFRFPGEEGHPLGKLNLHIFARVGQGTTCNHVVMVF